MSTTQKIASNTAVQVAGKILATFLGLLGVGMMTRYLGAEQFGWYITTISFLQFIGICIDFGMVPVTAQMLSEPRFDKKKLFQNLLAFRFFTAIIFLAFAPFIALFFPYPTEVKIAISFTSIAFVAISMNQVFIGLYQERLKTHIYALGEVLSRVLLVGGFFLAIQFQESFLTIMGVVTLSSVAYAAFLWIQAHRMTPATFAFDKEIWKAIMHKMWPIAISILFNVIYLKGDIVLLSLFSNQETVGLYGAVYRVIDMLTQTAMLFMGIMLPLLGYAWSRKEYQLFYTRYQQSFDILMMLSIPLVIGTFLLAKPLMALIAGTSFVTGQTGILMTHALQILSLAVFGVYLGAIFGHVAVSIDKQKQTMWIYISNAILTLGGYVYFIPKYGMYGAAGMTLFSELYAGILLWLVIRKYTQKSLSLKALLKMIVAGAGMGGVLLILPSVHILITIIIGAVTYGAFLLLFRVISIQTIKEIFSSPSS
ncbi:MAG: flippase [Candidatus Magasanikbacteria bacterium]|nr:flippase [Candidatus Magasanikbacteria bacterium]